MLLLYQARSKGALFSRHHLHSTMLLLYLNPRLIVEGRNIFTFHYASTLSRLNNATGSASSIYIPLCFYFILRITPQRATFHTFTFHYASTLSILPCVRNRLGIVIYIPLCFYFIRLSGVIQGQLNLIYIPLCFYFIWSTNYSPLVRSDIYIPLCFYFIETQLL